MSKKYVSSILLVIICVGVYATAVNTSFLWDDIGTILDNKYIKGWTWKNISNNLTSDYFNYNTNYYRPIPTMLNMLNFSIWGLRPLGHHLSNLILHVFNVLLVYFVLNIFFKNERVSFLTATLFSIHPVHVNVLSHVADNITLLCSFFMLSSMYLFFKQKKTWKYILSVILFAMSLLSKEMAVVLPVLLVIIISIFYEADSKRMLRRTVPFFVILGAYLIIRPFIVENAYLHLSFYKVTTFMIHDFSKVIFEYMLLLVFPVNIY